MTVSPHTPGSLDLFVPGRVCLMGEHTDWAGGWRRSNPEISPGRALLVGTDQGIHARVQIHPTLLRLRATLDDGSVVPWTEIPLDALPAAAKAGGFASYAAGVAALVRRCFDVGGVEIDNHATDLPVRKGLSSSAAICVLVARAFNQLYGLRLGIREEMELAYQGEIATPSRCGRLDQGCAFGRQPIRMDFDGDLLDVTPLAVGGDLHLVLVDLRASKDTHRILSRLNACYPAQQDPVSRQVREALGPLNQRLVTRAEDALSRGDARALGACMTEAQAVFDALVAPACLEDLAAPVLHRALAALSPWTLGGKGVGSQGDGSAQVVVADARAQADVMERVRALGMGAFPLTLRRTSPV